MSFASLHGHDFYSLGDGADYPARAAAYARFLGHKHLGITNHGAVWGLIHHDQACRDVNIHPVLGVEAYYQPAFAMPPLKDQRKTMTADEIEAAEYCAKRYHLTILVKNNQGYTNLMQMMTYASKYSFYHHPIFTDALLSLHHDGLILLSGCISSYIGQHIKAGDTGEAFVKAEFFRGLFKDDFYLEVMPHQTDGQFEVNQTLEVWSDLYHWPIVMTEDRHYVRPSDYESYKLLRNIKHFPVDDVVDYSRLYMHSEESLLADWTHLMHSEGMGQIYLNQSVRIAEQCDVRFDPTVSIPSLPGLADTRSALVAAAKAGAIEKKKFFVNERGKRQLFPDYEKRLRYELQTLLTKNFDGYMLLNGMFARWAKDNNVLLQGRGSVCGSLVAYFLGLHTVDPLKYGLSFDRFCGPDRVDWPDIDNDIEDRHQQELISYACDLYGGNAAKICTFGTLKAQGLCNHLIELLTLENGDAARFRQAIAEYLMGLEDPVINCADMVLHPELAYLERKYNIVTHFCWLWGQVVYIGQHPAGVALTVGEMAEKLAIVRIGSGDDVSYVTCYAMNDLPKVGVLKVDLLGLNTLSMLHDAEDDAGVVYSPVQPQGTVPSSGTQSPTAIYCDDDLEMPEVMKVFTDKDTLGIFQSEKRMPMKMYRQLQPRSILDLALVNACNRPMPLKEGTFDLVLAAHGRKTNGGTTLKKPIVYQEDVMEICRDLAGFSWEQIAKVLKSLKKYTINDPGLEDEFVTGYVKTTSRTESEARALWQNMRRYLFNKGHAVAYSHLAARQAWLKKYYPFSFFLGLLQNEKDKDKRRVYEADAVRHGVFILLPHVNGGAGYTKVVVKGRPYIQQGLIALPGIADATAGVIIDQRGATPYADLADYKKRCGVKLTTLERFHASEFDVAVYMGCCKEFIHALTQETQTSL